jgi:hypothetical protein
MAALDRRKHDVDVIERVLGDIRDRDPDERRTPVFNVDVPWVSGSRDQTLELMVGIEDTDSDHKA